MPKEYSTSSTRGRARWPHTLRRERPTGTEERTRSNFPQPYARRLTDSGLFPPSPPAQNMQERFSSTPYRLKSEDPEPKKQKKAGPKPRHSKD